MSFIYQQATLAEIGLQTMKLLQQVTKVNHPREDNAPEGWHMDLFAAQADRFELWAVNLGLFVSGHGSLDYRVREAEKLKNTLHRFISDLNESLTEVLGYFNDAASKSSQGNQGDSGECGITVSLEELDECSEEATKETCSDMELLLDSVRDPIDRLYKLSMIIRNPSCRLTSSKAIYYQQIDEESGEDLMKAFEEFDYSHISSLFLQYKKSKALEENPATQPNKPRNWRDGVEYVWEPIQTVLSQYQDEIKNATESFLVHRIARANVRRRKQFAHWKDHHGKLSLHAKKVFTQRIEVRRNEEHAGIEIQGQPNKIIEPILDTVPSVTTATRLQILQPDACNDGSVASVSEYAPSKWQPSKENVEFPSPPKLDTKEKYFECPYCFTLCSTELLAKRAWKSHLIHDLRPYMCTYEDCRNPDQLYDTRQEWIQHETSLHQRLWRCPEHTTEIFTEPEKFRAHLHDCHGGFGPGLSEQSIIDAAKSISATADRCCPICSLYLECNKSLYYHIALHLERFALFSLPRSAGEDEMNSDVDSGKADVGIEALRLEREQESPEKGSPGASWRALVELEGIWDDLPAELQPPETQEDGPETAAEFLDYYNNFVSKNLAAFQFSDKMKQELAERAVFLKGDFQSKYGLSAQEVATLTKISFYDIFFLCDNSGSMKIGNRVDTLNRTVQSFSLWATEIEPLGISLRFLNHNNDDLPRFNYLTSIDEIDDLITDVHFSGPSKIGTMLRKKIIQPLEEQAQSHKPRIIVIITDGEPTGEDPDCLRDVILHTKENGLGAHFGPASTVFLLVKVGLDEAATLFLDELNDDETLLSMIYIFNKDLGEIMDILVKRGGIAAYETLWMRLFNTALNSQTN